MRLTSAMWFGVFMRNETARGAYVSVLKSGAQEAGAIFIVQNHLNGTFSLFGPAPQAMVEDVSTDRTFECILENSDQVGIDAYLEKQKNFDPDLWIIESESGSGEISLTLATQN